MDSQESTKEKAKRLNVPLFHTPPVRKEYPKIQPVDKELMKHLFNTVIGVCETCNREITRANGKHPCGRQQCPFGEMFN